ncbi:uncharacterized protein LOC119768956 [Culex quinquefasciatus]|uniref:uncharacterized protein LOC119768956 n=1 Tax=Culex quinquefasciatus TaxID=7176 RepID=UPI0018E2CE0F|nr:uncharacterized protein LOC119768956 [Culex quinquefasciatus]
MLTRLVLLSVVAVNFVCDSVSSVESNRRSIIPSGNPSISSDGTHSVRTRASSSSPAGQRSPLIEIMLRILDTIQVVPKKRPRRAIGQKRHGKVATTLTSPEQSELDKAPLFSGSGISNTNNNKPLMESSLEQTIVDADQHLSEEDYQKIIINQPNDQNDSYSIEQDIPDYPSTEDSYETVREEADEKIYDLLLKILQILDDQAHRDAERVRRLGTLRVLDDHISNEHPTDDDDDGDLGDEIESD